MSDFNGPLSDNEPKELDAAKALFDSWNERGKCLARIAEYVATLADTAEKLKTPWKDESYSDFITREDRQRQLARVAGELQALLERR